MKKSVWIVVKWGHLVVRTFIILYELHGNKLCNCTIDTAKTNRNHFCIHREKIKRHLSPLYPLLSLHIHLHHHIRHWSPFHCRCPHAYVALHPVQFQPTYPVTHHNHYRFDLAPFLTTRLQWCLMCFVWSISLGWISPKCCSKILFYIYYISNELPEQ